MRGIDSLESFAAKRKKKTDSILFYLLAGIGSDCQKFQLCLIPI